ncbi:Leucine-rich repeat containing protein [Entamoeba marina]
MTCLEHPYLLNVLLNVDTSTANTFRLINHKCQSVVMSVLINPQLFKVEGQSLSLQTICKVDGIKRELKTFPHIQTLTCEYEILTKLKLLTPYDSLHVHGIDITERVTALTLFIYTNVETRFDFTRFISLKQLTIVYGFNVNEHSIELVNPTLNSLPYFKKLIVECSASGASQFIPFLKQINHLRIKILLKVIGLKEDVFEQIKEYRYMFDICSVFNNVSSFLIKHNIPLLVDSRKLFIISPELVGTESINQAWNLYYPSKVSIFGNCELMSDAVKNINIEEFVSLTELSLSRINSNIAIQLKFPTTLRSLTLSSYNTNPFPNISHLKINELKVSDCRTISSLKLPTTLTKLSVIDCEQLTKLVNLNNQLMRKLTISCPSVKTIVPYIARDRLLPYINQKINEESTSPTSGSIHSQFPRSNHAQVMRRTVFIFLENQKKLEEYLKKQKEYFDQVDQFQLDEVEIDENALMHEELEKEVNFPEGNSMLTDVDGKKSISIVSRDGINDTEVNQEDDSFLVRMEMPSKIEPIDEEMKKAEEVEMKYVSSK